MAFKYPLGNFGESGTHCTRVKLASDFVNLRCNYGQIDKIIDWGVFRLESKQELESSCKRNELSECRGFSEKSHSIYTKLSSCITKSECLVDQISEVISL